MGNTFFFQYEAFCKTPVKEFCKFGFPCFKLVFQALFCWIFLLAANSFNCSFISRSTCGNVFGLFHPAFNFKAFDPGFYDIFKPRKSRKLGAAYRVFASDMSFINFLSVYKKTITPPAGLRTGPSVCAPVMQEAAKETFT